MKTDKWTNYILLDDSGELSWLKRKALKRALARDPALRTFRDAYQSTRAACRDESDAHREVSAFTMSQIEREARAALNMAAPRPHRTLVSWRPALVYASLSALALGLGLWLLSLSTQPSLGPDIQIAEHTDALMVSRGEDLDNQFEQEWDALDAAWNSLLDVMDDVAWIGNGDEADLWALELLYLEGT